MPCWRVDSSESSSSSSFSDSEPEDPEPLSQQQLEYVEIGRMFLELSNLDWWFRSWDGDFNYMSD